MLNVCIASRPDSSDEQEIKFFFYTSKPSQKPAVFKRDTCVSSWYWRNLWAIVNAGPSIAFEIDIAPIMNSVGANVSVVMGIDRNLDFAPALELENVLPNMGCVRRKPV
jgi:hypothetical protein